jgi:hypothetical protein
MQTTCQTFLYAIVAEGLTFAVLYLFIVVIS